MVKKSKEYATYSDQLKSKNWQKKRLEILNLHQFTCEECQREDDLQLHVHHRFYLKNRLAWEYDNDVFQVLCEDCHKKVHEKKAIKETVIEVVPKEYKEIIKYIQSLDNDEFINFNEVIIHLSDPETKDYFKLWEKIYHSFIYNLISPFLHNIHNEMRIKDFEFELFWIKSKLEDDIILNNK